MLCFVSNMFVMTCCQLLSNDTFLNLRPEFMETPVLKELGSVVQSSVWLEFWNSFSFVLDK